jgi:hypothetical protein
VLFVSPTWFLDVASVKMPGGLKMFYALEIFATFRNDKPRRNNADNGIDRSAIGFSTTAVPRRQS